MPRVVSPDVIVKMVDIDARNSELTNDSERIINEAAHRGWCEFGRA